MLQLTDDEEKKQDISSDVESIESEEILSSNSKWKIGLNEWLSACFKQ